MVQTNPSTLNQALCPLCDQPNRCAMDEARRSAQPPLPCWCAALVFDQSMVERTPESARGLVCVCQACAQKNEP